MSASSQYLLLFYNDEEEWANRSDEDRGAIVRQYFAVVEEISKQDGYITGAPLRPTSTATTVRVRDGEIVVTDGPFAETKEQLGGYYLIDTETLDEALEWAAKIPSARFGHIEIRPVVMRQAEVGA